MTTPPRIVLIGPTPPQRGGVAHFTGMLSRYLRQHHPVTLWGFDPLYPRWLFPGTMAPDPSQTPLVCHVDVWLDGTAPWQWWRIMRTLHKDHYDLVIWQWWTPYWLPFLVLLHRYTRRAGLPTIAISHQLVEPDAAPWQTWVARWMLGHAAGVIFLGNQTTMPPTWHGVWRSAPLPRHHDILRQPLPTRSAARHALGIAADADVVLFFGFVRRYKGLDTMLRALCQTRRPITLVVAGEWWDDARSQITPLLDHPALIGRLIIHDSYIPNEQVANYLQAADVLVLPYRSGSVSGVATLAACVGLPILASTSGAIGQQPGTVATIAPDDIAAWATALDDHVGAHARPRPEPDASWPFFYQQLSEVWHDITP
jgi:D-inositol-3-phosphate glycosyltransferase